MFDDFLGKIFLAFIIIVAVGYLIITNFGMSLDDIFNKLGGWR